MTKTDDKANELDILESGVGSAFWLLMHEKFQADWGRAGSRYCDLIEKMANTTDQVRAAEDMQRVIWVRKELEAFFRYFPERLAQLKAGRDPVEMGQSRRGVL